jgi:hypothetical protein
MVDECQSESTGKCDNYLVIRQILFKNYNVQTIELEKKSI